MPSSFLVIDRHCDFQSGKAAENVVIPIMKGTGKGGAPGYSASASSVQ